MVNIQIYYVNGDMNEYEEDTIILDNLKELEDLNYKGKTLLDNLITDDWGATPSSVKISYKNIEKVVRYE